MDAILGAARDVPVLIQNTAALGIESIAFDAPGLLVSYQKANGVVTPFTLDVNNWVEGINGAYTVKMTAAEFDTEGLFLYWCEYTNTVVYSGAFDVRDVFSGTGDVDWVHTVTVNSVLEPGAIVVYYTDAGRTTVVAGGSTGSVGTITFHLTAGTYYYKVVARNVVALGTATTTTNTTNVVITTTAPVTGTEATVARYCTVTDVQSMVKPQLQFGTDDTRSRITDAVVDSVQAFADGQIDSMLSHVYAVPLRKYRVRGTPVFPQQIVMAAAALTSSMLIDKYFAETDPALSERSKDFLNRFDSIMIPLVTNSDLLFGQRRRSKSHFVTPSIYEEVEKTGQAKRER